MIAVTNNLDVVVAVVTAGGAVFAGLIKLLLSFGRIRSENVAHHDRVSGALGALSSTTEAIHDELHLTRKELREDIGRVHDRLDVHLRDHTDPDELSAIRPHRKRTA